MSSSKPTRPPEAGGNGADDGVGELIRLAGQPEAIPPERAARVREVVRSHWREAAVQRRRASRRRWMAAAAAILVGAAGWLIWQARTPTAIDPVAGQIVAVRGPMAGPREAEGPLRSGQDVPVGAEIATGETRVALVLGGGASIRLDTHTRIEVQSASILRLVEGATYVDSGPGPRRGSGVEIRTGAGRVHEIGTQFEVSVRQGDLRVRVREGRVLVDTASASHEVARGNELRLEAAGGVVVEPVAVHGSSWDWVAAIAPPPSLEGLSARAFLDWAARERGLELEFADDSVRSAASTTRLSGSIDEMTVDEALGAVLPTCRMGYEVRGGALWIRRLGKAR